MMVGENGPQPTEEQPLTETLYSVNISSPPSTTLKAAPGSVILTTVLLLGAPCNRKKFYFIVNYV
jgi:hypothetical protein